MAKTKKGPAKQKNKPKQNKQQKPIGVSQPSQQTYIG